MIEKINYNDPILEEALKVFLMFGYRKASLDEIAKVSGYSRQTIYQRYDSKEGLFKQTIIGYFERSLLESNEIVCSDLDIETKLFTVLNIWGGKFAKNKILASHMSEIIDVSHRIVGNIIFEKHKEFIELLERMIKDELPITEMKELKITSNDLANSIFYMYKGISLVSESHEEFTKELKMAISTILRPIKGMNR